MSYPEQPAHIDTVRPCRPASTTKRSPSSSATGRRAEHPERDQIYQALLAGLEGVDDDQATLYHDVVMAVLPEAARRHLEALMATRLLDRYQSEFAGKYVTQGLTEGEAKGEAKAIDRPAAPRLAPGGADQWRLRRPTLPPVRC
jgi:hypothetical protein